MKNSIPRILIGGTNSGCGKTTITCAILQALKNRGMKVGAFKCGPDYIDPMFHSRIIGAKSGNLDLYFLDENTARYILAEEAADCDISIIEGVMGYYDGLGIKSSRCSTYEVAQVTATPAVLTVNAKGASLSVLAAIKGFLDFEKESGICGVILNNCTQSTYNVLKDAINEYFGGKVRPLGFLPYLPDCSIKSRHLGLVIADEIIAFKSVMRELAEAAEKYIDLDGLLQLAQNAEKLDFEPVSVKPFEEKVRIGVAKDEAFCFYYEDSLRLLEKLGAEIIYFSPISDEKLPEGLNGLYLGGGYPELYQKALSENKSMLKSVKDAVKGGLPTIAECGGFMYLLENIEGAALAGVLPGGCENSGKLVRFGYVTLIAEKDNMLCKKGESIRAHEFHYYDADFPGEDFTAKKENGREWKAAVATDTLYAGYPHFHFYSNPDFAINFYRACLKEKKCLK